MNDITLKQLKNDFICSNFLEIYYKFLQDKNLNDDEYIKLLSISILLLNCNDYYVNRLGYHILIKYSITKNDYNLLDDLSRELFNTPILKVIKKNKLNSNGILKEVINDLLIESSTYDNNNCYTYEQLKMIQDFLENDSSYMLVAPTSFGKSDLIFKYVLKHYREKNICIIVPTKALINQTRIKLFSLFKDAHEKPKIITYQDVTPSKEKRNIYVVTQERLYSVLFENMHEIIFDVLMVDEAHNLFVNDDRSRLLSKIIIYLQKINKNFVVKYFSPIIKEKDSLIHKFSNNNEIAGNIVQPLIKTENIYMADFKNNTVSLYDRFFNKFIDLLDEKYSDFIEYIKAKSTEKNILYINSPKEIIKVTKQLSDSLITLEDKKIDKMITQIANYVNEEYDLLDGLKKGVVYHCGTIPDNVRIYIEDCVRKISNLKYILCSSTLLEGINMPFTSMFIIDIFKGRKYLTYQELINLIGRVNRFNVIFNEKVNGLKGIISNIYFIKRKENDNNYKNFISERLKIESSSEMRKDQVENPFLNKSKEEINEVEKRTLSVLLKCPIDGKESKLTTKIGKLMMNQNIIDLDLFTYESEINKRLETFKRNDKNLIDIIYELFISDLHYNENSRINDLSEEGARNHYNMILNWKKQNQSFSQMINKQIIYWNNNQTNFIYVGRKWGTPQKFGPNSPYIDKTKLDKKELINIAIIKIKEDLDYLDFNILRYIEVLYKIDLIDDDEYNLIKYGTNDNKQIFFIKEGLSQDLSKLLINEYKEYILIDGDGYKLEKSIIDNMKNENEILINELKYYLG